MKGLGYMFVPFPDEIWRENVRLTQAQFYLLGYLLRCRFQMHRDELVLSDEELLKGRRAADGSRLDAGCLVKGRNNLKKARSDLQRIGWITVTRHGDRLFYGLPKFPRTESRGTKKVGDRLLIQASEVDIQVNESDAPVSNSDTCNKREKSLLENQEKQHATRLLGFNGPAASDSDIRSTDDDIAEVYDLYPKRYARGKALVEIASALGRLMRGEAEGTRSKLSRSEAVILLKTATAQYAASAQGKAGRYTPHPTTWFQQCRYLDSPEEWNHVPGTRCLP